MSNRSVMISPTIKDKAYRQALMGLKEVVDVFKGERGDQLDRALRVRDLKDLGLIDTIKDRRGNLKLDTPLKPERPKVPSTKEKTPPVVTGLKAHAGVGAVYLTWDLGTYEHIKEYVVYRSEEDIFGSAVEVGTTISPILVDPLEELTEQFYWVRIKSKWDVLGPESVSVSAKPVPHPDYIKELINGALDETDLDEWLRSKIALTDVNAQAIADLTAELLAINDELDTYQGLIDTSLVTLTTNIDDVRNEAEQTKTDLTQAVNDAQTDIDNLRGEFDTEIAAIDSNLTNSVNTLTLSISDTHDELSSNLDTTIEGVLSEVVERDLPTQNALTTLEIMTLDLANKLGDIGPWIALTQTENATFRDAVSYVDPDTGQIGLYAVDSVQGQLNQVSITLDAVENEILSKVSQDTFNAAENRLTLAESTITQHASDINLRATVAYVDGVATDILSGLEPIYLWPFNSDADGFTATSNSTVTYSAGHINVVTTANGAGTERTGLSYTGGDYPVIQLQLKRVSGGLNLKLEYQTGGSWYTGRTITDIPSDGTYHWENINLTTESTYVAGTITGIRLTWDTGEYDIGHVEIGQSTIQQLQLGDLEARIQQAEIDIDAAEADILLRATIAELNAEGARIDTVSIQLNALDNEVKLNAASVDLDVDGLIEQQASTETTLTALTNEQGALAAQITTLDAQTADNAASITQTNLALADAEKAVAQQSSNLLATFGGDAPKAGLFAALQDYLDTTERVKSIAAVNQETRALATADESFASSLIAVTAAIDGNLAQIVELMTSLATSDSASAQLRTELTAAIEGVDANYSSLTTVLADNQNALSSEVTTQGAVIENNTAAITETNVALANTDFALSQQISNVSAVSSHDSRDVAGLLAAVRGYQENLNFVGSFANIRKDLIAYADENQAQAQEITELVALLNSTVATLTETNSVLATAEAALAQAELVLQTNIDGNTSTIVENQTAMSTEDAALAERIESAEVAVAGNTTSINSTATVMAIEDLALANRVDEVETSVGQNSTLISDEVIARSSEDSALASRVTTVEAQSANNTAAISIESTVRTTENEATALSIETVNTAVGENATNISNETLSRTTDVDSLGTQITLVQGQVGDVQTSVTDEVLIRASEDAALASALTEVQGSVGENGASIIEFAAIQVTDSEAFSTQLLQLDAKADENTALISTESSTRASEDNAISLRVDTVESDLGAANTSITSTQTTVASETQALAQDLSEVQSSLGDVSAAVTTEQTTRSSETSALASQVTQVAAGLGDTDDSLTKARAAIGESFIAAVDAGTESALAVKQTELSASNAEARAAISETIIAQVAAGGKSVLERFDDMQLDVNGKVAQVSYNATVASHDGRINDAQNTANGAQISANAADSRATALSARAAMRVSANGVMTGWAMEAADDGSGGLTSNFIISAQNFFVQNDDPNGVPQTPFAVLGNTVYIDTAFIQEATISGFHIEDNTLTGDHIIAGSSFTSPQINGGTITGSQIFAGTDSLGQTYAKLWNTGYLYARNAVFKEVIVEGSLQGNSQIVVGNNSQGNTYCSMSYDGYLYARKARFFEATIEGDCDVKGKIYAANLQDDVAQPIYATYSQTDIGLGVDFQDGWLTVATLSVDNTAAGIGADAASYAKTAHIVNPPMVKVLHPGGQTPSIDSIDLQCYSGYSRYLIANIKNIPGVVPFQGASIHVPANSTVNIQFRVRIGAGGGAVANVYRAPGIVTALVFKAELQSYGSWS